MCHVRSSGAGSRGWRSRCSDSVPGPFDYGIALASWGDSDAENAPVPESWPIQTGTGRCVRATNGQREQRGRLRRRDLHCGRCTLSAPCPRNRHANPLNRVSITLSTEFQQSVRGAADTARTLIQQGFSRHRARSRKTCRMAASQAPRSASESGWQVY